MTVFKMVNEFALEYRTTRDKILQQRKRLADKRERNKTRGKIWALEGQNGKDCMELNGNLRRTPVQMNAEQVSNSKGIKKNFNYYHINVKLYDVLNLNTSIICLFSATK